LEEAKQHIAGDPYLQAPGVSLVSIREWQPVFGGPQ
jgi:uncharacterized protein YciI